MFAGKHVWIVPWAWRGFVAVGLLLAMDGVLFGQLAVKSHDGSPARIVVTGPLRGPIKIGDTLAVMGEARLMDGDQVLLTFDGKVEGDLVAKDVKGPWVAVEVRKDGKTVTGWVEERFLGRHVVLGGSGEWMPVMPARASHGETDITSRIREWEKEIPKCAESGARTMQRPALGPSWASAADKLVSAYYVDVVDGKFKISDALPDRVGKIPGRKGQLQVQPLVFPNDDTPRMATVLNGRVWTPRLETVGDASLVGMEKITDQPGFSLEDLAKTVGVVPFLNGYGVNLYGASVNEGMISKPAPAEFYTTTDGRPLYGRLIRPAAKEPGDSKAAFEEVILLPKDASGSSQAY